MHNEFATTKMKSIVLLWAYLTLVSAHWIPRTRDQMFKDRDDCFISGQIPTDLVEKIKNDEFPDEPEIRCYLRCILKAGRIWDDEKGYIPERGHAELGNAGMQAELEELRKCALPNTNGLDSCGWAASVVKCFARNNVITKIELV